MLKPLLVAAVAAHFALSATPASAHGDIASAIPKVDAAVRKVPRHLAIQFTEAPTQQARVSVLDGCRREVGRAVSVADDTAHVTLADAQPGRFRVSYRIVSDVDGHPTRGSYSFAVRGERNCSEPEAPVEEGASPPPEGGGGERAAAETGAGETDEGSSMLVWIAVGSVGAAAVAFLLRGRST